ncbi:glucose-6-phosphate dehydrogenase [Bacillus sp. FJAT-27916]|uniref:glucose-6-phosphate dehydrogenase n=1 Tax=Bacillus sp. FJAT-27916 TaxID=1679169 RepID=UPI000670788D|nr:glucose-6-phosphate dehydrogenase [Bacillus sp. FJAT-27916]KMY43888.1 glucose-6-phosphate dehydrogenase [Bacillus sp. FJAT-27916]
MPTITKQSGLLMIFGATGDLAQRKLFPSLYRLYTKGRLSENFACIGIGRREWTTERLKQHISDSIMNEHGPAEEKQEFTKLFYYQSLDVSQKDASFNDLKKLADTLDTQYNLKGNRLFYLAMAPEYFGSIATRLKEDGLTETSGYKRLVIEKPFGHDFESAKELNDQLRKSFAEDEIYRIDHYLGKEMVQNIEVIRFANAFFEPLWNNHYIANIQITSTETLGVEDRGRYYENSGALRDMVQNHIMQIVSLLAMEPPIKLSTDEIRSEKVKVLRALKPIKDDEVDDYFVRGQYGAGEMDGKLVPSYREENMVADNSNTETFVAGKLLFDNFRWAGVPFYIRTGKRLGEKSTQIVVQFKDVPMNLFYRTEEKLNPNLLVINIQPEEGITLHLNAKKGGKTPVQLNFLTSKYDRFNTPEAYERLLFDAMRGDATNFSHWDEVALSWKYTDVISRSWEREPAACFPNYPSGSMGPLSADELLAKDGFHWWPVVEETDK